MSVNSKGLQLCLFCKYSLSHWTVYYCHYSANTVYSCWFVDLIFSQGLLPGNLLLVEHLIFVRVVVKVVVLLVPLEWRVGLLSNHKDCGQNVHSEV